MVDATNGIGIVFKLTNRESWIDNLEIEKAPGPKTLFSRIAEYERRGRFETCPNRALIYDSRTC
jgi:hypothetical protein